MAKVCPSCGTQAADDQSRFCNKCGAPFPEDQREDVAARILATLTRLYGECDASRWLLSEQQLLGGMVPDDLLRTGEGALVLDLVLSLCDDDDFLSAYD